MKIIVTKILSLNSDGACSYLLNIGNQVKILLDCGLSHDFNFQSYQKFKNQIQSVNLILISHSSIQYSGALPFLITQFDIDPKIIYTTQPIMRYSPLNFHQEILNMRYPFYDKKIFNKIYTIYESVQVIKPYQKKAITVDSKDFSQSLLKESAKTIHFSSYQAGAALSSLCWKIRTGLVNILYMVDYNNFSLNHINGLDLQAIKNQPINLLLTDTYPMIPDQKIKKDKIYIQIKKLLIDFYSRQNIDPTKPKAFLNQNQKKLLITCYPNEMLLEIMITLRKVLSDMQEASTREKVVVIHLSSRFLQLIKSQVENFSDETKPLIDKIDEFFIHSKSLNCRINVSSINQVNGILNQVLANNPNIEICHFGQEYSFSKVQEWLKNGRNNLSNLKLFKKESEEQALVEKIEIIKKEEKMQEEIELKQEEMDKQETQNINLKIQRSLSSMLKQEKQNLMPNLDLNVSTAGLKPKSLVGKYLSQISFPHFVKSHDEQQFDFNDYGLKHHLEPSARPLRRTINDINFSQNQELPQLNLIAKKSTVEVMNIQFNLPQQFSFIDLTMQGRFIETYCSRTNFSSSLKIMQILNPKHVFFLNSANDNNHQRLLKQYKSNFKNQIYSLSMSPKNQCIVQVQNQLAQYKVNYLALGQNPLQKVKGKVQSINGVIHLHIQILQQKEVLQFRIQKFYKECKNLLGKELCKFTGNGIMIAGIKIYRQGNTIIFEGQYSQAYFKVRNALYQFLKIR